MVETTDSPDIDADDGKQFCLGWSPSSCPLVSITGFIVAHRHERSAVDAAVTIANVVIPVSFLICMTRRRHMRRTRLLCMIMGTDGNPGRALGHYGPRKLSEKCQLTFLYAGLWKKHFAWLCLFC